jgi:hypothetical protein
MPSVCINLMLRLTVSNIAKSITFYTICLGLFGKLLTVIDSVDFTATNKG